jgi:competence protein ComEC
MSTAPDPLADDELPDTPPTEPWREFLAAPLVPLAVAATLGLVADRFVGVPSVIGLSVAVGGLVGWFVFRAREWALVWAWVSVVGLAAFYHHAHRHEFPPTDVARFARAEVVILKVRGTLVEEPFTRRANTTDPLAPPRRRAVDVTVLDISEADTTAGWQPCTGRVRLWVDRDDPALPPLNGLRAGDTVQAVGRFHLPDVSGNPGERDQRSDYLDRGWRGDLRVSDSSAGVVRLDAGGWSHHRVLGWVRQRSAAAIDGSVGEAQSPVGKALLLGDTNALDRTEWDAYTRTGVVHVLAISGQHLMLLAGFVWLVLSGGGMIRPRAAWVVAAVVIGYALLTGLRPSALRAAVMVAAVCGSVILRRPVNTPNGFALAWLVVIGVNPTAAFDLGCRLSFVSVFALVWGVGRWVKPRKKTPIEKLIDASRSWPEKAIRAVMSWVALAYVVNAALFVVNTPLLVAEQNIVSPVSLLVGPPLVLLISVALLCGFLLMLFAGVPLVAELFALFTRWALAAAEWCVHTADRLPLGSVYLPGLPAWWLVGFYGIVGVIVLRGWRVMKWWNLALPAWVFVAVLLPGPEKPPDELRTAFLSVGHGGCVVMETPDGRCLLYDCGTTSGPDAVRRVIAPYLWSRGIRRVDELFVSHADGDHFNGIGELVRRFPVGRVTFTPSFTEKPAVDVAEVVDILKRANVPIRVVSAGQRFEAGDVTFEVLHPPAVGPPGVENERSLVLVVRHAGHVILLTGDLEKAGSERVLSLAPTPADVLMAPHHGSRAAYPSRLRTWADPKCVLVSRGNLYSNTVTQNETGVPTWDTFTHGTLTVRSNPTGITVEGHKSGLREVIRGK